MVDRERERESIRLCSNRNEHNRVCVCETGYVYNVSELCHIYLRLGDGFSSCEEGGSLEVLVFHDNIEVATFLVKCDAKNDWPDPAKQNWGRIELNDAICNGSTVAHATIVFDGVYANTGWEYGAPARQQNVEYKTDDVHGGP